MKLATISVFVDWNKSFQSFYDWSMLNGYKENLTLDRIDNNLGYSPDNCRWATTGEQSNNKTNNVNLTHNGKTQNLTQWAKELGFSLAGFSSRYYRNLPREELFTKKKPTNPKGSWHCKDRLTRIWRGMKARCLNPNSPSYKDYGERGIKICNDWLSLDIFKDWALTNGYADNLSIERIDNNGNYCPENCQWITIFKQSKNKRSSVMLTYNGETLIFKDWARKLGISQSALRCRIVKNMPEEKIFHVGRLN